MGVGPATASRAEQWSAVARVLQAGVEGPFPPLQLTMLWNLCVDMTSSGAPVLDRLPPSDCRGGRGGGGMDGDGERGGRE